MIETDDGGDGHMDSTHGIDGSDVTDDDTYDIV